MKLFGGVPRWLGAGSGLEALKSWHHMMKPKSLSTAMAKGLLIFHGDHKDTLSNNKN